MNKENRNIVYSWFKYIAGGFLSGLAWVSLPDQVYTNYTDATRDGATLSLK